MSLREYKAFKSTWKSGTNYLRMACHMPSEQYLARLRAQRDGALHLLREQGCARTDTRDDFYREIEWLDKNRETASIVHQAASRIMEARNSSRPFRDAYDCACYFFLNNAFFRAPVRPQIRPAAFGGRDTLVVPIGEIGNIRIGSRNSYEVRIHNLYRGLSSTRHSNLSPILRSPHRGDYDRDWKTLMRFRDYLRCRYSREAVFTDAGDNVEVARLAFMQHFKKEAKLRPPMLDLTYDPFVALYFATSTPEDREVGVIYRWSLEHDIAAFSDFSCLGHLSVVLLAGVERIRQQRALLLNGPTGDVLDQLVPFRCEFKQHEGQRFSDPEIGICDRYLLGDQEGNEQFCRDFWAWPGREAPEQNTSLEQPSRYLDKDRLFDDVAGWIQQRGSCKRITQQHEENIRKLVEFHLELEQDEKVSAYVYSLRNLTGAAEGLADGRQPFDATRCYWDMRNESTTHRVIATALRHRLI